MANQGSGASQVFTMLSTFRHGTQFTASYIRKALPHLRGTQVGNALHKLADYGALKRLSTKGHYELHEDMLTRYGKGHNFTSGYSNRSGSKSQVKRVVIQQQSQTPTNEDVEVLGKLLDAMAMAEPVIRKYQDIAKAVAKIKV